MITLIGLVVRLIKVIMVAVLYVTVEDSARRIRLLFNRGESVASL